MKHNTHIYLATKGIEFLYAGLSNLQYATTKHKAVKSTISKQRKAGKVLQRMLIHYQDALEEASWAPDDILNDKSQYHTFKLFTDRDFPNSSAFAKEIHEGKYYRASGGGGLPYKIDHLARVISDMDKLRKYNDFCSMKQIMYQYVMISHYIVDAHVPMHCDLRDDPPSASDTSKPRNGDYYSDALHGEIEEIWEKAVNPVAFKEGIIVPTKKSDTKTPTDLSEQVRFDVTNADHRKEIIPYVIPDDNVLKYMIDICINSKNRSLELFPIGDPFNWDRQVLHTMTREIFAQTIGNLITIWIWIWSK